MRYKRKPGPAPASIWGPAHPGSLRFTTAKNEIMGRNQEYLARMDAKLKSWDVEVAALAAAGGDLVLEARDVYDERIRELHHHRAVAQAALRALQLATVAASRDLHAGVELAWDTMSKALAKASEDSRG
jgi:histidinol-phosphate/aromatic aminotransferase/cobyric acid decarboxylase-like protein